MDKPKFVETAPMYYAFLIVDVFAEKGKAPLTIAQLDKGAEDASYRYFQKMPLVAEAVRVLAEMRLVTELTDDFGPTAYRPAATLSEWWTKVAPEEIPLARKILEMGNRRAWLLAAVKSVNEHYDKLKIGADDFVISSQDAQWAPIPLNRGDETLVKATDTLEAAIVAIEQDNGYSANVPGERDYVLSNLKTFHQAIKQQSQIYWMQIKVFALEPLGRVITRFGPAAVGVAATAARTAIIDWLKKNFTKALDWIG